MVHSAAELIAVFERDLSSGNTQSKVTIAFEPSQVIPALHSHSDIRMKNAVVTAENVGNGEFVIAASFGVKPLSYDAPESAMFQSLAPMNVRGVCHPMKTTEEQLLTPEHPTRLDALEQLLTFNDATRSAVSAGAPTAAFLDYTNELDATFSKLRTEIQSSRVNLNADCKGSNVEPIKTAEEAMRNWHEVSSGVQTRLAESAVTLQGLRVELADIDAAIASAMAVSPSIGLEDVLEKLHSMPGPDDAEESQRSGWAENSWSFAKRTAVDQTLRARSDAWVAEGRVAALCSARIEKLHAIASELDTQLAELTGATYGEAAVELARATDGDAARTSANAVATEQSALLQALKDDVETAIRVRKAERERVLRDIERAETEMGRCKQQAQKCNDGQRANEAAMEALLDKRVTDIAAIVDKLECTDKDVETENLEKMLADETAAWEKRVAEIKAQIHQSSRKWTDTYIDRVEAMRKEALDSGAVFEMPEYKAVMDEFTKNRDALVADSARLKAEEERLRASAAAISRDIQRRHQQHEQLMAQLDVMQEHLTCTQTRPPAVTSWAVAVRDSTERVESTLSKWGTEQQALRRSQRGDVATALARVHVTAYAACGLHLYGRERVIEEIDGCVRVVEGRLVFCVDTGDPTACRYEAFLSTMHQWRAALVKEIGTLRSAMAAALRDHDEAARLAAELANAPPLEPVLLLDSTLANGGKGTHTKLPAYPDATLRGVLTPIDGLLMRPSLALSVVDSSGAMPSLAEMIAEGLPVRVQLTPATVTIPQFKIPGTKEEMKETFDSKHFAPLEDPEVVALNQYSSTATRVLHSDGAVNAGSPPALAIMARPETAGPAKATALLPLVPMTRPTTVHQSVRDSSQTQRLPVLPPSMTQPQQSKFSPMMKQSPPRPPSAGTVKKG